MASSSFAGLGGGILAGAAVAAALAAGGYFIYQSQQDSPEATAAVAPPAAPVEPAQEAAEPVATVAEPAAEPAPAEAELPAMEAAEEAAPDVGEAAIAAEAAAEPVSESAPETAETAATPEAETQAQAASEPAPAAEAAATPETEPAPAPPTFDIVRIDAEGNALVAGAGQPNADISIRLDRAEIATTAADPSGKFVALFSVDPSSQPRVVSLVMTSGGKRVGSDESVIIEPAPEPRTVAAAETEAEPAPEATEPQGTAAAAGVLAEAAPASEAPAQASAPAAAPAAASTAPRVLLADQTGVRVLQDDSGTGELSIDTVGYTATGDVQIAGRGQGGRTVRLYLDGAVLGDAPVEEAGIWSTVQTGIAPGLYALRADEIGADGKVSARTEIPFKRESAEVLAAARATPEATAPAPAPQTDAAEAGAPAQPSEAAPQQASTAPASPAAQPAPADGGPVIVTVQPGFTLWGIASQSYGDGYLYVKVFEANADQIRDPDLIYPGQIFTLPE